MKPENILPLARKDVKAVKKEARFVLEINSDGEIISMKVNENGKIWSIAIIGPASLIKEEIKKVLYKANLLEEIFLEKELLLMEIGLKRGKPYRIPCQNGVNILWRRRRRKWFYLSEKQYLKVSPNLFWFLQYLCQETWHKWKNSKNPFIRNGKSKSFRQTETGIISSGVRYSFSLEDIYFVADVFWAEKNLNSVQKKFISWFGKILAKILSRQHNKRRWEKYVKEIIYSHPLYLLERVVDNISDKYSKVNLLNLILDVKKEEKFGNKEVNAIIANVFPAPEERLGNIQVRIRRIKRNCLIFEVYPEYSRNIENYFFGEICAELPKLEEKSNDECPF